MQVVWRPGLELNQLLWSPSGASAYPFCHLAQKQSRPAPMVAMKATPPPHRAEGQQIIGPDGMIGDTGFSVRRDGERGANAEPFASARRLIGATKYGRRSLDRVPAHAVSAAGREPNLRGFRWAGAGQT